jgi:hypothetical protein
VSRELESGRLDGVNCSKCGSLTIRGAAGDRPADDEIDAYLEAGAGIDTILANLFRASDVSVTSVLDVG